MQEHIDEFFIYPKTAIDLGLQAVVNVNFEINQNGLVDDINANCNLVGVKFDNKEALLAANQLFEKAAKDIDNPNLTTSNVDVSDYAEVESHSREIAKNSKIDILINNAGITGPTSTLWEYDIKMWKKVVEINLMGTFNILSSSMATSSVSQIIVITTDKVYQENNNQIPYTENMPLGGLDPYSASKSMVEILCKSFKNSIMNNKINLKINDRGNFHRWFTSLD